MSYYSANTVTYLILCLICHSSSQVASDDVNRLLLLRSLRLMNTILQSLLKKEHS